MEQNETGPSIERGLATLGAALKDLPETPGIYRMIAATGEILYIGKAKALRRRVSSYTQFTKLPIRLQRMVAQIERLEFIHTHTEAEALLLESNLIKREKPRYNILLRDDKSFPYIFIPAGHDFPLISKHRGARKEKGAYFGPFASAGDVNRTILLLQKIFMLRNCTDSTFASRTRPCLQYHIKRCTAPCVGLVSKQQYADQAAEAMRFLEGKSREIQERMSLAMQDASAAQNYEAAAALRDKIRALTSIQSHQDINIQAMRNADVMVLAQKGGRSCVQVFFFRAGRNFGNRSYFPRHGADDTPEAIMEAFIGQFYVNKPVPAELLLSHEPPAKALLEQALESRAAQSQEAQAHKPPRGPRLKIQVPQKGPRRRVIDFALRNAHEALERYLTERAGDKESLEKLASLIGLEETPARVEVYDNSHISGTLMVGAMIVAGPQGLRKAAYRKFNIRKAEASDDYGMMREVLCRRFSAEIKAQSDLSQTHAEPEDKTWPDLILIDGGQGQLSAALEALKECGVHELVRVMAIAKGPDRNAGRETFFLPERKPFDLPKDDPLLHYLQRLRDEAHRFAVGAHRTRRKMAIEQSLLDDVPGIGPARKKALLMHFGSAKAVAGAGVSDLEKVEGISRVFAQKLYDHFH